MRRQAAACGGQRLFAPMSLSLLSIEDRILALSYRTDVWVTSLPQSPHDSPDRIQVPPQSPQGPPQPGHQAPVASSALSPLPRVQDPHPYGSGKLGSSPSWPSSLLPSVWGTKDSTANALLTGSGWPRCPSPRSPTNQETGSERPRTLQGTVHAGALCSALLLPLPSPHCPAPTARYPSGPSVACQVLHAGTSPARNPWPCGLASFRGPPQGFSWTPALPLLCVPCRVLSSFRAWKTDSRSC